MMFDNLLVFFKDSLVNLSKLGNFLISPIIDVPNLPSWATSPLALFSVAGISLVIVMSLISLLNPLS